MLKVRDTAAGFAPFWLTVRSMVHFDMQRVVLLYFGVWTDAPDMASIWFTEYPRELDALDSSIVIRAGVMLPA